MIHRTLILAVALALTASAGLALAAVPTKVQDTAIGKVLADAEGITLYTFDNDPAGGSACVGDCADQWQPHWATDADQPEGDYSVVTRTDGSKQWAYKGKPLYTLRDDAAPGDTKGEGAGGVWHAARP